MLISTKNVFVNWRMKMYNELEDLGPLKEIILHHSVEASFIEKTYKKRMKYNEWVHKIMMHLNCYSYPFVYYCDNDLNIIGLTRWFKTNPLKDADTFNVLTLILNGTIVEHTKFDYRLIYKSYPPISKTDSGVFVYGVCAIPEGIDYNNSAVYDNVCKLNDTYNTYGINRTFDISKLTKRTSEY